MFSTPSNFNDWSNANEFNVTSSGELNGWNNVSNVYGVRPISNFDFIWGLIYLSCVFVTPSRFNNWNNANGFYVTSAGALNELNTVSHSYGVRPISYYS